MVYFSFNDFMDCEQYIEKFEVEGVREEIIDYQQAKWPCINSIETPSIIKILKVKKELKNFLDNFFKLNILIENYKINYCKNQENVNSLITCKINDKQIFIVVKEIQEIDLNIAYKMFEISTNIIKLWNQEKSEQKIRNPIVIPIVIYTGKNRWKYLRKHTNDEICYIEYRNNGINFSYNMLDINDISQEKLENMNSKVAKEMLKIKGIKD